MKVGNKLKLLIVIIFVFGILSTGFGFVSAYSSLRNPATPPQGLPVTLKIPAIGVDALVEDALVTPDGRMDSPKGIDNVAWYALGPNPGEIGSAVIGGHYGVKSGAKTVFYNLNKLKKGDLIYSVDDTGKTLTFIVRSTKIFDRDDDAATVFTSHDGKAHLNLITCEGAWNESIDTYEDRLVIFTDLVPGNPEISVVVAPIKNHNSSVSGIPSFQPELTASHMNSMNAVALIGLLLIASLMIT